MIQEYKYMHATYDAGADSCILSTFCLSTDSNFEYKRRQLPSSQRNMDPVRDKDVGEKNTATKAVLQRTEH